MTPVRRFTDAIPVVNVPRQRQPRVKCTCPERHRASLEGERQVHQAAVTLNLQRDR
jgi:hypothetical protein